MARIHLQAHRGACQEFMENTIPAFERAVQLGADSIELDVQLTADQVPVVFHDYAVEERGDKQWVRSVFLSNLQAKKVFLRRKLVGRTEPRPDETTIATLAQVFQNPKLQNSGVVLDVEIKRDPNYPEWSFFPEVLAKQVIKCVRANWNPARLVIRSFDPEVLAEVKRTAPDIKLGLIWDMDHWSPEEVDAIKPAILAPHFSDLTEENIAEAKSWGVKIIPYTVNKPAEWERLSKLGVDGITTDNLAGAIAHFT